MHLLNVDKKTQDQKRQGLRGYVSSRAFFGNRAPQHAQNLVIRDHCQRYDETYLLSAVEYTMHGSFMILAQILEELPSIHGLCCYSLFMLPVDSAARARIWQHVLKSRSVLHAALEDIIVTDAASAQRAEDIWRLQNCMSDTPKLELLRRLLSENGS